MPFGNEYLKRELLANILAYGPAKTKKTWWALTAALAGFNVIHINGDDGGADILNMLPKETRDNILVVNAVDTLDKEVFFQFLSRFFVGNPFLWDEQAKETCVLSNRVDEKNSYLYFHPKELDRNTVIVCDGLTPARDSVIKRYNKENKVSPDEMEEAPDKFEFYRKAGMWINWLLAQKSGLNCHFIMIAHQTVYEKKKQTKSGDGKMRQETEWTRTIPSSTSNPQGMTMAGKFSEVLRFKCVTSERFTISNVPDGDVEAGSRLIQPKVRDWNEFDFGEYCKIAGIPVPYPDEEFEAQRKKAFRYFAPGEPIDFVELGLKSGSTNKVISGNKTASVEAKPKGKFTKLLKAKKEQPAR